MRLIGTQWRTIAPLLGCQPVRMPPLNSPLKRSAVHRLPGAMVMFVVGAMLISGLMLGCGASSSDDEAEIHGSSTANIHEANARVPAGEGEKKSSGLKVKAAEKARGKREGQAHEAEERRENARAEAQEVEEEERE